MVGELLVLRVRVIEVPLEVKLVPEGMVLGLDSVVIGVKLIESVFVGVIGSDGGKAGHGGDSSSYSVCMKTVKDGGISVCGGDGGRNSGIGGYSHECCDRITSGTSCSGSGSGNVPKR